METAELIVKSQVLRDELRRKFPEGSPERKCAERIDWWLKDAKRTKLLQYAMLLDEYYDAQYYLDNLVKENGDD